MGSTRFSSFVNKLKTYPDQDGNVFPVHFPPIDGEMFFDTLRNLLWVYNASKGQWVYEAFTTTTSTSTSTTTTSTSTTTTSTSTSTTTSTSTSTSTSTTTTL